MSCSRFRSKEEKKEQLFVKTAFRFNARSLSTTEKINFKTKETAKEFFFFLLNRNNLDLRHIK